MNDLMTKIVSILIGAGGGMYAEFDKLFTIEKFVNAGISIICGIIISLVSYCIIHGIQKFWNKNKKGGLNER